MKAYFSYINARKGPDGKRGVMGRQIIWKYYDDGYNPANTVLLTRRLVEQDKVFATVGQLGTEQNLAVRGYMNQQKVPQALVSTGASNWGLQYREYPWTTGWQPDYIAEGRIYGLHIKAELQRQEDRGRLPERRLRQGLPVRLRAALGKTYADANVVARRRSRLPRPASRPDGADSGIRGDHLRDLPAPDADRADDRDRQGSRVQPGADLHELGLGRKPAMA